ncbi:DUF3558 domain-containing protein [Nocardia wallacei]|uniref:DUF3558 domain-containing protein n=1 Tax=Nocardia wallacei TaxID=480035 RepID=UPI002454EE79|nr:DUF3558 domain-containing protein [Nocardia wallacei]
MRRNRFRALPAAVVLAVGVLAACSSGDRSEAAPDPAEASGLAGCGPLTDKDIAVTAGLDGVRAQAAPTVCSWVGVTAAGDSVDVSYSWFRTNSLMFDRQIAVQLGYRTETFVSESFGGFEWHDPRDAASCGASAADSGTVTWWVRLRAPAPQPDPCEAARQLIFETVQLDG